MQVYFTNSLDRCQNGLLSKYINKKNAIFQLNFLKHYSLLKQSKIRFWLSSLSSIQIYKNFLFNNSIILRFSFSVFFDEWNFTFHSYFKIKSNNYSHIFYSFDRAIGPDKQYMHILFTMTNRSIATFDLNISENKKF